MIIYKIKAPTTYNGIGYGLMWSNGEAETDNKRTAETLKSKGYKVDETIVEATSGNDDDNTEDTIDISFLDDIDAVKLTAFAKENNIEIGQATSEKTLRERITKALEENKVVETADAPINTLGQSNFEDTPKMSGSVSFSVTSDKVGDTSDSNGDTE